MVKNELNFGLALRECRDRAGLSQEELAHESELDRTYISMLERNLKAPTLTTLNRLAQALKMKPTSLLSLAEKGDEIEHFLEKNKKEKMKFPFMGTAVSCGTPITEDYKIEKEISIDDYVIKNPKKTFFVKATGQSMAPLIEDGDLLVIEVSNKARNADIVLVQIGNEFTVKRYFKSKNELKFSPENPLYKDIVLSEDKEAMICGVVTGLIRSL